VTAVQTHPSSPLPLNVVWRLLPNHRIEVEKVAKARGFGEREAFKSPKENWFPLNIGFLKR